MKYEKKTRKLRWCFLLCCLFACPNLTWAQQIAEEPAQQKAVETAKVEKEPLDLIFRKIDAVDFNGSAYTISGDQIRNLPVTSLTNLLAGIVPGFYSRQSEGGMANESAGFWIRG
ncbi:MAG: Plug domain-containing protein, partial [bacterium]|nr:Plug domain-containing protein [bacterium]